MSGFDMGSDRDWFRAIGCFVVAILLVGIATGACVQRACTNGWRVQSPITRSR